jgi:hypothetical protein
LTLEIVFSGTSSFSAFSGSSFSSGLIAFLSITFSVSFSS